MMVEFREKGYIEERETEHYVLTSKGIRECETGRLEFTIPSGLNGWFYGQQGKRFWKRLTLLIQVLSNLQAKENKYYPIIQDETTLKWMKEYLLSSRVRLGHLTTEARIELEKACEALPTLEADLLIHRLSGFQCHGLTTVQLSEATGKSPIELMLLILSGIHRIVKMVLESNDFPLLNELLDFAGLIGLTDSARKTYNMLRSGLSIDKIAASRHLKAATIEDHIVEIAFSDPLFSIGPFISPETYQIVADALKQVKTRKLSSIKQLCPDYINYFHIRLVLAREKIE